MTKVCEGCKREFTCGSDTGNCWCDTLPVKFPLPTENSVNKGCYCISCMRDRMDQLENMSAHSSTG